jgi:hypothetical protein
MLNIYWRSFVNEYQSRIWGSHSKKECSSDYKDNIPLPSGGNTMAKQSTHGPGVWGFESQSTDFYSLLTKDVYAQSLGSEYNSKIRKKL